MKIAVAQVKAIKGDIKENIQTHLHYISKAIKEGVDFIVFPELSITGYESGLAPVLATDQNDSRFDVFQELSDEHGICIGIGLPSKSETGPRISMAIFQPGKQRILYSKQFLHHTETCVFSPGTDPLVIEIKGIRIGIAICFELSVEAHSEYAAKQGAKVYIASVCNAVGVVEKDLGLLAAIAKKHNMTTFMSNFVGHSGGYHCGGKSSVWNEKGELQEQLDEENEGMIVYTL